MKSERRAVARYSDKLQVEIEIDGLICNDAISMDISLAGARLFCEGGLARNIFTKHIKVTPGDNLSANLVIKIPKPIDQIDNIYCEAAVIYVNRASQSSYVVGLKFSEFKNDSKELWESYIQQQLEKLL